MLSYLHILSMGSDLLMKKKWKLALLAIALSCAPFHVLAYSDRIIPGGENIGIEIEEDGIMIVGFYKVNGKYEKGSPALKGGDVITKVGETRVYTIDEMVNAIEHEIKDDKVTLTYKRNGKEKQSDLPLGLYNGVYKTGLYVKDGMSGIGTLTYIDPETKIYGALGHEILESTTSKRIEVRDGLIFKALVTGIEKSVDGTPGGKNAKFYPQTKYGTLVKNTEVGIFGKYVTELPQKEEIPVGTKDDVTIGSAKIYTVLHDDEIKEYEIYIDRIDEDARTKNIHFEIQDEKLLEQTGGVVQGMSGSPIIQHDKIIGAVTHVIVDNVKTGYGVFITTMLEEGEK